MANSEPSKGRPQSRVVDPSADAVINSAPKALTKAQNAVLTIKVLVGAGVLIALAWFLDGAG